MKNKILLVCAAVGILAGCASAPPHEARSSTTDWNSSPFPTADPKRGF